MARPRQHTREFKLAALARMDTAPDVLALAQELGVERSMLYRWQRAYLRGGAMGLRSTGRPVLMQPGDATAPPAEHQVSEAGEEATSPAQSAAEAVQSETAPLAAHDPAAAARRIAELERKIGRQQLDLDFVRAALRHLREQRRTPGGAGGTGSTR